MEHSKAEVKKIKDQQKPTGEKANTLQIAMDALRQLCNENQGARIIEDAMLKKVHKAYGKVDSLDDGWLVKDEVICEAAPWSQQDEEEGLSDSSDMSIDREEGR